MHVLRETERDEMDHLVDSIELSRSIGQFLLVPHPPYVQYMFDISFGVVRAGCKNAGPYGI